MSQRGSHNSKVRLSEVPAAVRHRTSLVETDQFANDSPGLGFSWSVAALSGSIVVTLVLLAILVELLGS